MLGDAMEPGMSTWDVFLAHASADQPRVEPLVGALRGLGLRVFYARDSVPLGAEWDLSIPRAQRDSAATVVCVSSAYIGAFYERAEVHLGIGLKRRGGHAVLPVYLDGRPDDDPLYGLNVLQGVSLPELGVVETARRVAEAVRGLPGVSAAPSPPPSPPSVTPIALYEALCRLSAASFDELVFRSGLPRATLLPQTVAQSNRAINLIERASELTGDYQDLLATLRAMRPGMI